MEKKNQRGSTLCLCSCLVQWRWKSLYHSRSHTLTACMRVTSLESFFHPPFFNSSYWDLHTIKHTEYYLSSMSLNKCTPPWPLAHSGKSSGNFLSPVNTLLTPITSSTSFWTIQIGQYDVFIHVWLVAFMWHNALQTHQCYMYQWLVLTNAPQC